MNISTNPAPGAPGTAPKWTSSSKSGLGKSLNYSSDVAFTVSHGILNEVYYPREDNACIRDMGLIITDGENFFSEEKRDTSHITKMLKPGIPAYQIRNTCNRDKFEIIKEIITDPLRDTVLQKINFKAKQKDMIFKLYVLLAPHLNDRGAFNYGWIEDYKGVPMMFAENEGVHLALACSTNFIKRSAGYVGSSDGWTDLKQHKEMQWEYDSAGRGNIALTGEIDIAAEKEFVLALSFGKTKYEAAHQARASLLEGFGSAKKLYIEEWRKWQKSLQKISGEIFKISAMVLRMHEAKRYPGAIIASLSIPWGDYKGDGDAGGYHVVWARDLIESSGGFRALLANQNVTRIVNYLMATQNSDGSWPQNMWLQGTAFWTGVQMDQVALPVLELYKCYEDNAIDRQRMGRYWPLIKKSLAFLIVNGPYTAQDRWEEEQGYTPFTMATEIAGLLAGAELAELNGEKELAVYCRETADYWNQNIEKLTYVTNTNLARKQEVEGYYIRLNPFYDVSASELNHQRIELKNHSYGEGHININELISIDALALVRFGLRRANDPKILNTIKVIDSILKVDTPNGPCWYRYNKDGYGEHENGDPYDGSGIGRAWPLLTGERGHYEVAAGNLKNAKKMLSSMEAFANNGLIPEQIWDTDDIPEKGLYFGKHSGSGMPLTWAHAEYIKLCISIQNKKVFDMPSITQKRYLNGNANIEVNFQVWRFKNPVKTILKGNNLRIETIAAADVIWTNSEWNSTYTSRTKNLNIGIFVTDLELKNKEAHRIEFTFFWLETKNWENKNYSVEIVND